jgi:pyruvate phosphate dikinase-like enzyme
MVVRVTPRVGLLTGPQILESPRPVLPRILPGGFRADRPLPELPRRQPWAGLDGSRGFALDPALGRTSLVAPQKRPSLSPEDGAFEIPDRESFEHLAHRDDSPGAPQIREVKFLLTGIDTDRPKLHFINTNQHPYHFFFARDVLGYAGENEQFNAETYFTDKRKNVAGSILLHENFAPEGGPRGLYAVEFWPTDAVAARHVAKVMNRLERGMPFARDRLAYHPAGDTQQWLFKKEAKQYRRLGLPTISTRELFAHQTYGPLNLGEGVGRLRIVDPKRGGPPPTATDVVIFKSPPNDLSHVAGILTETPQTPLSHINLKAKQNGTPNAYLKGATTNPEVLRWENQLVYFKVGPDGFELRAPTDEEIAAFEAKRPAVAPVLRANLDELRIRPLSELGFEDADAYGAKTANLAELRKILPEGTVPDGVAIPFAFYDRLMRTEASEGGPTLYERAREMLAAPSFGTDAARRDDDLAELRAAIAATPFPRELETEIARAEDAFPQGASLFVRSSTNNEDLPGFNGAGLYDSLEHPPEKGALSKTVKEVMASLWGFRAFEERSFYRVDHFQVAMGSPLAKFEAGGRASGVAYTKNIYDPNWPGFYINAQAGKSEAVTSPEEGEIPDELLVSRIGPNGEYETQYIRHSNKVGEDKNVLTRAQLAELVKAMERIHVHFAKLYDRTDDSSFAMDVEFMINHEGRVLILQARPVVD